MTLKEEFLDTGTISTSAVVDTYLKMRKRTICEKCGRSIFISAIEDGSHKEECRKIRISQTLKKFQKEKKKAKGFTCKKCGKHYPYEQYTSYGNHVMACQNKKHKQRATNAERKYRESMGEEEYDRMKLEAAKKRAEKYKQRKLLLEGNP